MSAGEAGMWIFQGSQRIFVKNAEKRSRNVYALSELHFLNWILSFTRSLVHLIANMLAILIELRGIAWNPEVLKFSFEINRCFTTYPYKLSIWPVRAINRNRQNFRVGNPAFAANGSGKTPVNCDTARVIPWSWSRSWRNRKGLSYKPQIKPRFIKASANLLDEPRWRFALVSLRKDLLFQTETMGNSFTWTEFCSTFQMYLNLNLRAKLREWKLNCQKNSVNPKGTQIAKYSTALKDTSSSLIWALWLAPLHSRMDPRLNLNTMNFVGVRRNVWECEITPLRSGRF